MRNLAAILVATAALATHVAGQVALTGVVRPLTLPSNCQQGTHGIECNPVRLQSHTVDLAGLEGQNVRMLGFDVGVECPVFEVFDVQEFPPTTLTRCGSPVPGCELRLRSGPGALSQHWLLISGSPGFVPVNPVEGTFMLGEPFLVLGPVFSGAAEGVAFDFTIPPDFALTGIEIFAQSARRDVGPIGPLAFSNPVCLTILGPSPPCIEFDC